MRVVWCGCFVCCVVSACGFLLVFGVLWSVMCVVYFFCCVVLGALCV